MRRSAGLGAAGFPTAIVTVAGLTALSGILVALRMREAVPAGG